LDRIYFSIIGCFDVSGLLAWILIDDAAPAYQLSDFKFLRIAVFFRGFAFGFGSTEASSSFSFFTLVPQCRFPYKHIRGVL